MGNINKEITVANRKYILSIENEYGIPSVSIEVAEFSSNDIIRTIEFIKSSDYTFRVYLFNDSESMQQKFVISKNDVLYNPFYKFLGKDLRLIIDDDYTRKCDEQILTISRDDENIYLLFNCNKNSNKLTYERFEIFVKNILYDGRSKIDQQGLDTKDRLPKLFSDMSKAILNYEKLSRN